MVVTHVAKHFTVTSTVEEGELSLVTFRSQPVRTEHRLQIHAIRGTLARKAPSQDEIKLATVITVEPQFSVNWLVERIKAVKAARLEDSNEFLRGVILINPSGIQLDPRWTDVVKEQFGTEWFVECFADLADGVYEYTDSGGVSPVYRLYNDVRKAFHRSLQPTLIR